MSIVLSEWLGNILKVPINIEFIKLKLEIELPYYPKFYLLLSIKEFKYYFSKGFFSFHVYCKTIYSSQDLEKSKCSRRKCDVCVYIHKHKHTHIYIVHIYWYINTQWTIRKDEIMKLTTIWIVLFLNISESA